MVTRRRVAADGDAPRKRKKVRPAGGLIPTADKHVQHEALRDFGKRNMVTYAIAVNLDRSVPDLYDGLKPVQRRILWAASQQSRNEFVKSARVVGDVLGKYHPHGDASVYGAMVTLTHMPTPTFQGRGNWGNMVDGPAAYRYTAARLSQYGHSFFLPDYIHREVATFVPNYDDKDVEPVTLPAQLPNVIINGGDGIGVGITTGLPTFTPESVITMLERLLKGEKLASIDFAKGLKFAHKWGGKIVATKENKAAWLVMFRGSETSVKFESDMDIDRDHKKIVISDWPRGTNLQKFVDRVRAMPECLRCYNSKGSSTLTIDCKPAYNYDQFDKFANRVQLATRKSCSFKINVTRRVAQTIDGVTSFDTKFEDYSVSKLIVTWLKMRIELELRSLAYRERKQNEAIAYSKLLIFAADKLDIIFKALKSKDPDTFLVKALKLTPDQAKQILELKVRQLSKLDQDALKLKLKDQQKFLAQIQSWIKKPRSKVLLDLAEVKAAIAKDQTFKDEKGKQKLTVV